MRPAPPAEPCLPPLWARGGHLQTLAAQYLPTPHVELPWERFRLILEDGDALAIQALRGRSGVVVSLFHGLGGSVEGHYMRRAAALCHAAGHTVVAVNHRGAGAGRGLARGIYHSGATSDMAAVLGMCRQRYPGERLLTVGFSISANILLLLAGRDRHLALPDAGLAVNPPADLEACSRRLLRGFSRAYDQYFLRRLGREVAGRPGGDSLGRPRTLRDFDEAYTARQAGFPSRAEYYAACSCGPHLAGVDIPMVILTSEDDPFAPGSDVAAFPRSGSVHLHLERTGGHMGYIARNIPGHRWLDYALAHYVGELSRA
ncbi:YheT family hydrolase [Mesoterricola sediminis]|uniref:Alpha/beta hydrolase n=1 Tax=Mesoterricola sediminis TaxID=2927980 RepID=A0AA48GXP0_9BACT|nr:alpha/beta fold hydrolase [Mesoterricola sediminis]BDU75947.1 alpha/beta hydrolase [Mesoterricola sediminis]